MIYKHYKALKEYRDHLHAFEGKLQETVDKDMRKFIPRQEPTLKWNFDRIFPFSIYTVSALGFLALIIFYILT